MNNEELTPFVQFLESIKIFKNKDIAISKLKSVNLDRITIQHSISE
jgi:hypothetical protein